MLRIDEADKPANRCEKHRTRERFAEERRGYVDIAHVHQYALTQRETVERETVAAQRRFGICAAGEMIPQILREIATRRRHDFLERHKIRRRNRWTRTSLCGVHARMRIARGLARRSFELCHSYP